MGLSPARRQPIIWTIDSLLSISLQATYFQEILFGTPSAPPGIVVHAPVRPFVPLSVRLSVRRPRRYRSNSLRILAIGLKFGEMIHSNMKQIAFKMAKLGQFSRVPQNFEYFHDTLGPGLRNNINATTLNCLRISAMSLKFGAMMHSTMKQIVI